MKKIAIIGNGGGGKTTLSRQLKEFYNLPLMHVDSVQFLTGMNIRNTSETSNILSNYANQEKWIIDGFGSLEVMEERFNQADRIIFVDFPLYQHYWWCTKRQIKSLWSPREELPANCNEATIPYTFKLYKTLWRVHRTIRPKLLEVFNRPNIAGKVIVVKNTNDYLKVLKEGLT